MSKTVIYKTYTIRSTPLQLLETGQWTIGIVVTWERDGGVVSRPFSFSDPTYQSEHEADIHGITFGQRIIDGKIPGLSVN